MIKSLLILWIQKYYKYQKKLEVKRSKKWKNVREKSESNSKQNASSNAPNVGKDNMLLNVSHNNDSDCCDLKENLKDSLDSFLGTNMVSEANIDSNNIQNENTKMENAIDEIIVVKVNETFITDNHTSRKKKQKKYPQVVTQKVEKTTDQNISCLKKELQLANDEKTIDLTKIKNILLQDEKLNSSRIQTSPPVRVTNSSTSRNKLNISENMFDLHFLSSQDEDLVNIQEELQNRREVSGDNNIEIMSSNHLNGHFCSETIFNLNHGVLSDAEIKVLEKGSDFAPIQRKINEPEIGDRLKLDINFLNNSKQLGVYPKFLIFKLPNVSNKDALSICNRLLHSTINKHNTELQHVSKELSLSENFLSKQLSTIDFYILTKSITSHNKESLLKSLYTQQKRLSSLTRDCSLPIFTANKTITNHTQYELSQEESDLFKAGPFCSFLTEFNNPIHVAYAKYSPACIRQFP